MTSFTTIEITLPHRETFFTQQTADKIDLNRYVNSLRNEMLTLTSVSLEKALRVTTASRGVVKRNQILCRHFRSAQKAHNSVIFFRYIETKWRR